MDKQQQRQRSKRILKKLDIERKSEKLSANLFHFLIKNFNKDCVVGAFSPIAGEPHWDRAFKKQCFTIAYPRLVKGRQMEFAVGELAASKEFGTTILVPIDGSLVVEPELLLIPGLAFGRRGERLGRGGGFFDHYLAGFRGLKIGLCFEEQLFDDLTMEEHDSWMNIVITDQNIYMTDR